MAEKIVFENRGLKLGRNIELVTYIPAIAACAGLMMVGQFISPGFARFDNFGNILNMSAVLCVVGIAQLLVVVSGGEGIDLSVGPVMSMSALFIPQLSGGMNNMIVPSVLVALGLGALVGLINGAGSQIIGIPPLIVTMIMGVVVDGFTYAYTHGVPLMSMPPALTVLGTKVAGPFCAVSFVALGIIVIFEISLRCHRFGKALYLIGSNRNAAHLSGIKMRRNTMIAYMMCGVMSAVAGIMLIGYTRVGNIQMATSYTMLSIAALAIGGADMMGGKGTVIGLSLGGIVLTLLSSVLVAAGFNAGMRQFIEGLMLIFVLIIIFAKNSNKLQR